MNVDSFDRETTRVATLTLLNSVMRAFGIASANRRSSSGDGFQITDFGSTGSVFDFAAGALTARACGTEFVDRISVIGCPLSSQIEILMRSEERRVGKECRSR